MYIAANVDNKTVSCVITKKQRLLLRQVCLVSLWFTVLLIFVAFYLLMVCGDLFGLFVSLLDYFHVFVVVFFSFLSSSSFFFFFFLTYF